MTPAPICADGSQQVEGMNEPADSSLDTGPADLSELPSLGDEREFAAMMDDLIAGEMPRLFAIVQEYGERVDGWIAAWGMAFADHAEMIFDNGARWMTLRTPDKALRVLKSDPHVRTRLVWLSPAAATHPKAAAEYAQDGSVTL
jgi:hypothetical protein